MRDLRQPDLKLMKIESFKQLMIGTDRQTEARIFPLLELLTEPKTL